MIWPNTDLSSPRVTFHYPTGRRSGQYRLPKFLLHGAVYSYTLEVLSHSTTLSNRHILTCVCVSGKFTLINSQIHIEFYLLPKLGVHMSTKSDKWDPFPHIYWWIIPKNKTKSRKSRDKTSESWMLFSSRLSISNWLSISSWFLISSWFSVAIAT